MTAITPNADARSVRVERFPGLALARFLGARTIRTGGVWGTVVVVFVLASASGFTSLGATPAARERAYLTLATNPGLKALLGDVHAGGGVGGFIDWRALGALSIMTAVWALLAATRELRGEEVAGRWELFLSGRTTARRATLNALAGLGAGALVMFILIGVGVTAVGRRSSFGFSPGASIMFAVTETAAPCLFFAVGALASQLIATRGRAAAVSSAVLALAFMLRALGDAAPSVHWLVYVSPLGWVEQVDPLGATPRRWWLVPLAALVVVLASVAVALSDRDLGSSTIADQETAVAHTRLLGSGSLFAVRLLRSSICGWLLGIALAGWLYGTVTASAAKAFTSSTVVRNLAGNLTGEGKLLGAKTFAGVIFLVLTTLVMAYAASAVSGIREQEAEGYLDSLLVRRVSRWGWLAARAALALVVTVAASVTAAVTFWVGSAQQRAGLSLADLLRAGVNASAPGVLLLGLALAVYGFRPRLTAVVAYGAIVWSFLLEMLGSAFSINHWIMDTSLLHHIAPAGDEPRLAHRGRLRRHRRCPCAGRSLAVRPPRPRSRLSEARQVAATAAARR
jgi:ABC-2 type transport system permease protein